MATQAEKAQQLRSLHIPGHPLVLLNVWDVMSARVVASHPDTRALATASWTVAASLGYGDGEDTPMGEGLAAIRRIARSTDLPVTADFEKGYAAATDDLRGNIVRLIETGAVGLNIEDSLGAEDGPLRPIEEATSRIAAVRQKAAAQGIPLVINARTDVLVGGGNADDAIARGNAYLDAGADCIFVLGGIGPHLRQIIDGIHGPVSVLAGAGAPSVRELAELGVARISVGPGSAGVAFSALRQMVDGVAATGNWPEDVAFRP